MSFGMLQHSRCLCHLVVSGKLCIDFPTVQIYPLLPCRCKIFFSGSFTLEIFDAQCLYIRKNVSDSTVCQCHYIFIFEESVVIAESLYFVLEPYVLIAHCHCVITLDLFCYDCTLQFILTL
jgi:hypothetical protein